MVLRGGSPADGVGSMLITCARCGDPQQRAEWEAWWDAVHLADTAAATGATSATRWRVHGAAAGNAAGTGFTDVAMYQLDHPAVDDALAALVAQLPRWWAEGRMHPRHVLTDADTLVGHGPHGQHPLPEPSLTGRILAYVMCIEPARATQWDAWYDAEHLPDMLATGVFSAASRWQRTRPPVCGARHATLYDVTGITVDEAVTRSAAAMPPLTAAGRKPSWHAGGATLVLEPAEPAVPAVAAVPADGPL